MIELKQSKAIKLWLGVLFSVLIALYFQTQHYESRDTNFLVHANADAVGAKILIDGKEAGVLSAPDTADISGSLYRGKLTAGEHLIEISKPGFADFSEKIKMDLEGFVGITLIPKGNSKAPSQ